MNTGSFLSWLHKYLIARNGEAKKIKEKEKIHAQKSRVQF